MEVKNIPWLFCSYARYDCSILTVDESKICPIKVIKIHWLAQPLKFIGTCLFQGPQLVSGFLSLFKMPPIAF